MGEKERALADVVGARRGLDRAARRERSLRLDSKRPSCVPQAAGCRNASSPLERR